MKASGADVVLIDPQYAPPVLGKPKVAERWSLIDHGGQDRACRPVPRFAVMRHWHESRATSRSKLHLADELHMNDWSYGCLAKLLGETIAEAATRSTATATGPRVAPR